MATEWREASVDEIRAQSEYALATGPFGSNIGSRFFTDSGVPVIRGSNLSEDVGIRLNDEGLVFLSLEKAREFSRSLVRDGDLVFTCWGTVNQIGLVDRRSAYPEYVVSNKQMKLTPDPAKADSLFLYYLFSSPEMQQRIQKEAIGSSVPGFNLGQLRTMRIRLPGLKEQRVIARILGALDDKIELNRRTCETLEAMARALFTVRFGAFAKAEAHGLEVRQVPYDVSLDGFEVDAPNHVPEGWTVKRAEEIFDIAIGRTPPRKEHHWFSTCSEDIPWISIRDLGSSGAFVTHARERLTRAAVERFRIRRIPDGTVVLSFKLTVGRVAITDGELVSNEAIAHFLPRHDMSVSSEYLFCYLRQFDFGRLGSTSSIATAVNSDSVRAIPIVVPPNAVHADFHRAVLPMFQRIKCLQREGTTLAALRDILLPKLVSGELRIGAQKDYEAWPA